ncbi:NAD-dependent epimerase/dehydratase family protein [Sphingomonas alpina]|uniref:NAD(P)H-binding protein n=1 Tax=Sphingomonas alpina TaxID=653931 RepID=A0A7H0LLK4_9SPHN|nr:NAD(P)H-binding protein [Sphingomonas alpina]QNQ10557.1 NAD(P)H-binding protein [Sphingomonas alpina]
MSIIAITGGTGFVGGVLIDLALAAGHPVRALARRDQPARDGLTWIAGSLEDTDALFQLATGADAVVHVAGVVNAATPAGFIRGNVEGTANMLAAAATLGIRRFVHVSSLAAREPQLSNYGHSKERAEAEVLQSDLDWTIVRPPGVYGPGDMDMLDMFRVAKRGIALLPPPGKISLIEVSDLARLLLALVSHDPGRIILEADDGAEDGWTHDAFARAIGAAVGQRVLPLALPKTLLSLAARGDRLLRRDKAKLTPDRVGYLSHPDWRIDPERRPSPDLWQPRIPTPQGLAATAAWYRANSLL